MNKYRDPVVLKTRIVEWIRSKVKESGCSGAVLGVSGGIDSAVLSALLSAALSPENVLGVIMPCNSIDKDEILARKLAEKIGFKVKKVDLTQTYNVLVDSLNCESTDINLSQLALANIKPRLRMTTLYAFAQSKNYLVCGASNRDELMYGYFTKHGDSGVDLLPISGLLKGEVYLLAEHLGVIREIIDRPPSAGLWEGQTDEQEMGVSYQELDEFLAFGRTDNEEKNNKIQRAVRISEHKRRYPSMPEL